MRMRKNTDPAVDLELLLEYRFLDRCCLGNTCSGCKGTREIGGASESRTCACGEHG